MQRILFSSQARLLLRSRFFVASFFLGAFLLSGFCGLVPAHAEALLAGVHYDPITPPIARSGTKPEVVEVFNFKCPHCYTLFSHVAVWMEKNQQHFTYKALPVFWGKQTDVPLRAYFAAEFLDKGKEMKKAIFNAHFGKSADIENVEEIIFLAEAEGLDSGEFRNYLESFGVSAKIAQSKALQNAFRVSSTPTLVVNGKYQIAPGKHARDAHGEIDYDRLFQIVETLAAQ